MRDKVDKIEEPGRRRFIEQAGTAGLLTALSSRFSTAYGESPERRGSNMTRTILMKGKFATLDPKKPRATAVAIRDGVFEAVGGDDEIMRIDDADTKGINLGKRTVIPGLNDSHTHVIRGGLH